MINHEFLNNNSVNRCMAGDLDVVVINADASQAIDCQIFIVDRILVKYLNVQHKKNFTMVLNVQKLDVSFRFKFQIKFQIKFN